MTVLGFPSSSDVTARVSTVGSVIAQLDGVFKQCITMPVADLSQWSSFKTTWDAFVQGIGTKVPLSGLTLVTPIEAKNDIDEIDGTFSPQVARWQAYASKNCGATSINIPNPPKPALGISWWKWALGGVVVVAVGIEVLPFVAPMFLFGGKKRK